MALYKSVYYYHYYYYASAYRRYRRLKDRKLRTFLRFDVMHLQYVRSRLQKAYRLGKSSEKLGFS